MSPSLTLIFPDRKLDGSFPVTDDQGELVARVAPAWSGGRFIVTNPDGRPLCQASTRWSSWSGTWLATDAGGAPLLSVRPKLLTLKDAATVRLERGGALVLDGNPWGRNFTVRDVDDRIVLTADPRTSPLSVHPHDYVVREVLPGVLLIPEVIALVQIWRMIKKNAVVAGAGAGATVTVSGA